VVYDPFFIFTPDRGVGGGMAGILRDKLICIHF